MRATARAIVEKDCWHRKHGLTDDPAGRIARAMEAAYRQGAEDTESVRSGLEPPAPDPSEPLDLGLISRGASSAFTLIARSIFGGLGRDPFVEQPKGYLHMLSPAPPETREERWEVRVWMDNGFADAWSDYPLSRKAVGPWRTHGLVQPDGDDGHLRFTPRAFTTWRTYLATRPDLAALWGRY